MEAKVQGGNYTFGRHFWNQLVFGFVPAQLVGRDFKESLKFELIDDAEQVGFEKSVGTCESGIAEAFMAFGYAGCGLFLLLGAFMRWLWDGAMSGSIFHQFFLMLCTLGAVMSISLQLWPFVNFIMNILIFAGPFLWWSRLRPYELRVRQGGNRVGRMRFGRSSGKGARPVRLAGDAKATEG
jgi:hypothetical protein